MKFNVIIHVSLLRDTCGNSPATIRNLSGLLSLAVHLAFDLTIQGLSKNIKLHIHSIYPLMHHLRDLVVIEPYR